MNVRSWQDRHRLQIRIAWHNNACYLDRIQDLEQILMREPEEVEIELIGTGEIPADTVLVIRSVLMKRQPKTRIITNARSSLQHAAVLVWLLGDERYIRDDAQLFFRKADLPEEKDDEQKTEAWKDEPSFRDLFSDTDPEEADYARVLQLINEYLPVSELTGRFIDVGALRQFGLIENEKADKYLARVFASNSESKEGSVADVEPQKQQQTENQKHLNK
jgi:hypothetical protein